jgi:hypothetical protein
VNRGWQSEVETAAQLRRMRSNRTVRRRERRALQRARRRGDTPEQRAEELRRSNLRAWGIDPDGSCTCYLSFDPDCPARV